MPVNLSIKKVPDRIVRELRRRAKANHRSLQGELLTVLEHAVAPPSLSVTEVRQRIAKLGLRTPEESVRMLREDRDAR